MRRVIFFVVAIGLLALPSIPRAQAGKLQMHFMDVGQGDGAILVAPDSETVLFDNGVWGSCTKPLTYLQSLGITKIDYQIISHYHRDHCGCTAAVLAKFPLLQLALDRGGSYHDKTAFDSYTGAVGTKRRTATEGQTLTLNAAGTPVIIRIAALNGNGVATDNENDEYDLGGTIIVGVPSGATIRVRLTKRISRAISAAKGAAPSSNSRSHSFV